MGSELSKTIHVRISRAAETVWEGEAATVSSTNSDGPFDILPSHAHFISIIVEEPIVIKLPDGSAKEYSYSQSVMHVKDDAVRIYADIYGDEK